MAKKPSKNSSGSTSNLSGGDSLKFPKLIDEPISEPKSNGSGDRKTTSSSARSTEVSGNSIDFVQNVTPAFDAHKFYFLSKKETIFSAIASGLLILFTILLTVSAQVYKPTKSNRKTYGPNVASILKTSAYEHAALWAVIAIFMFVATFFIKRRAPIIVAAVLASFALGLVTPYGLIYIALAGVVGYNAYKLRQDNPKESRPAQVKSSAKNLFRKSKSDNSPKNESEAKKATPKPSNRYTPPKPSGKKK